MTFLGVYQVSCGPIPMKIGGNRPGAFPELPIQSKPGLQQENPIFNPQTFQHFSSIFFSGLIFSSPAAFARIPGSEPIHLDLEKLFLLSVSKENFDFR